MSPADDGSFEMADLGASWPGHRLFDPLALDEGTASRICDGLGHADVPPGYVHVANLLAAATAPADAAELESESTVVAAFAAEPDITAELPILPIHSVELPAPTSAPGWRHRRGSLLARLPTRKIAVAALTGGVMLGGSVAVAATGSLPGAAQGVASHVLGLVGIDVPRPNGRAGEHPGARDNSGAPPQTTSSAPGSPSCAASCAGQAPLGASGPPGTGSSGAPVSAPNAGGTRTANTASKGASLAGTTRADRATGGASTAGPGIAGSHPGPSGATGANGASGGGAGGAGSGGTTGSGGTAGSGNASAGSHPGAGDANSSGQGQAHGKP